MHPLPVDLKELRDDLDGVMTTVQTLAERSDLAVLLSKRLEQVAEPVATLSPTTNVQDEIQAVINEHAQRIMEYADMLLQMETLLTSKADSSGLLALKASIQDLQQKRKSRAAPVQFPNVSLVGEPAVVQTNDAVQTHERMISQLFKDLESLGRTVLIMSGHDKHLKPVVQQTRLLLDTFNSTAEDVLLAQRDKEEPLQGASRTGPHALSAMDRIDEAKPFESHGSVVKDDFSTELLTGSDFQEDGARTSHETGIRASTDNQYRIAKPQSDYTLAEANTVSVTAQQLKYEDLFHSFEEALKEDKIQPKENSKALLYHVQGLELMSMKLKEAQSVLARLQDDITAKANKIDLQKILRFVQTLLDRPDGDRAMFTGKPLLGFRCVSCEHPIERLNPNRAEYVPTNIMPKQLLPMLSAERIYAFDKKEAVLPSESLPQTPSPQESLRVTPISDSPSDNPVNELKSVGQQLNSNSANIPRHASPVRQTTKSKAAKKMQTVQF